MSSLEKARPPLQVPLRARRAGVCAWVPQEDELGSGLHVHVLAGRGPAGHGPRLAPDLSIVPLEGNALGL